MKIQMADSVAAKRIETGVVQFDGDWPGVFIRGDEALAMASLIELYLAEQSGGMLSDAPMKNLLALLRSCDVNAKAA